jgi:sugar phosphate isomerase/epimerase
MGTAPRVGISAKTGKHDLSDFKAHLDEIEALGVEMVELPTYDLDLVVGGRVFEPNLRIIRDACAGRRVGYSAHGPLSINFCDEPFRLPRHFEVLKASLEVAAALGAVNYVLHVGWIKKPAIADAMEAAYARQREWLDKVGEAARPLGINVCVENLFDWEWGGFETPTASRLAAEIAAVGHPNIAATIDFSHAQIEMGLRGGDVVPEVKALAPFAKHLHIHDSFGRPDDIYMYSEGERLAYGHGDLHLPVGWGSTPWDSILAECTFPEGVVFNIELPERYWHMAQDTVDRTKAMAARARIANR